MAAIDTDAILRELSAFRAEVREEVATAFTSLEQSNQRMMREIQLLRATSQQQAGNRGHERVSEPMRRDSGNPGSGAADRLWCRPGPVAEGSCADGLAAEESFPGPVAEGSYRGLISGLESPSRTMRLESYSELPSPTGPRTAVFGDRPARALRASDDSSYSARGSIDKLGGLFLKAEKSRRRSMASQVPAKRGSVLVAEEYTENGELEELELEGHHGIWQRIQKSMKRPLHPNGTFRIRWDLFLLVLLLYVCITAPVIVSFDIKLTQNDALWWVETFVTVMFVIDIIFNFNTAYFGVQDHLVTNRLHIAANYVTSWLVIDVVAVFPFELVAGGSGDAEASTMIKGLRLGKFTRLFRVLRVVKLLRILKFMRLSPMLKEITAISGQNFLRLVSVVGSALLLLHLMACSFFMAANLYHQDVLDQIGPITSDNMEEKLEQAWESTWVGMAGLSNETSVNRYITALYWSVYTLTTVGYGDVSPQNVYEKLVAMAGMMVGVTVFAYFMGNTASFIAAVNSQEAAISKRVMQMKEFLHARRVPNTLSNKISHFYTMAARKQVLDDNEIVKGLSAQLRTELLMFLYRNTLQKVPFFEGQNPQFITSLVSKLKLEYYADGDMVVAEHDTGSEMYFVVNGMLEARKYKNAPAVPISAAMSRASSPKSTPGLMRRITLTMAEQTHTLREKLQPREDRCEYKSPFIKLRPNGDDYEVVDVLQEGEHFGETAIILGHPRSSTVVAVEFSELYSLAQADLLEVYQQWPELYRQFQVFVDQINDMEHGMGSSSRFDLRYVVPDDQPPEEVSQGSNAMNLSQQGIPSPGVADSGFPEGSDRVTFNVPGQVDNEDLETGAGDAVNRLRENSKTESTASEVVATIQKSMRMRRDAGNLEIDDCESANGSPMQSPMKRNSSINNDDVSGFSRSSSVGTRVHSQGYIPSASRRMKKTAKRVLQMQEEGVHQDNPVLRLLDNGHDLKALKGLKHQTTKTREGK